jgi:peptide/nickel transport system substrate-binding protein
LKFIEYSILVLGCLLLLGGSALAQQRGGSLTVALSYDVDTLDPYSSGFLTDVQATIFEGLVAPNSEAQYVPVLATEVPTLKNGGIVLTDNGKKMDVTYHLRPNVKWADGQPFTSADVKFTWEAVKNPGYKAAMKQGSAEIESIDTPDPLTVVVHYKHLDPNFMNTLFTFGIFPKHVLEGQDLNTTKFFDKPFGTGPFMVKSYKQGQYVVLTRNPYYWRKDANGVQLPYLDQLIFKIIPDSNTIATQLKSGEVQMAYGLPYSQADSLKAQSDLNVISGKQLAWAHLDFNFKGPKALQDLKVRQAIAYSINKEALVKALGGYPKPIDSVVLPIFPFYNPDAPKYPYNPEKANKLLDSAGYKKGPDGIRRDSSGNPLHFRILSEAGRSNYELMEQVIIADLKAIGIQGVADNKTGVAYREAHRKGDYDLYLGGWITPADPDYSIFYSTDGSLNGQGYSNPKLDKVLTEVNATLDPAKRKALFFDFQKILMTDLPTVPLTTLPSIIAVTNKLHGFVPNPTNLTDFISTSDWYLK